MRKAAKVVTVLLVVPALGSGLLALLVRDDNAVPSFVIAEAERFARTFGDARPAQAVAVRTTWGEYRALPGRDAPLDVSFPDDGALYVVRLTGEFTSHGPCVRAVNYPPKTVRVVEVLIDAKSHMRSCWQEEPRWPVRTLGQPTTVRIGGTTRDGYYDVPPTQ